MSHPRRSRSCNDMCNFKISEIPNLEWFVQRGGLHAQDWDTVCLVQSRFCIYVRNHQAFRKDQYIKQTEVLGALRGSNFYMSALGFGFGLRLRDFGTLWPPLCPPSIELLYQMGEWLTECVWWSKKFIEQSNEWVGLHFLLVCCLIHFFLFHQCYRMYPILEDDVCSLP